MKTSALAPRKFALCALLTLGLLAPANSLQANAGLGLVENADKNHVFQDRSDSANIVIGKNFKSTVTINYAGQTFYNQTFSGVYRGGFGAITTGVLPWFGTITITVDVYYEKTGAKLDSYKWTGKLPQMGQSISMSYRCKDHPGERDTPTSVGFSFEYDKFTMGSSWVGVSVR